MSTRKIFVTGSLPFLMFLFVAGPAAAKPPIPSSDNQPEFLLRTPEARVQAWRDGLIKFVTVHQDLTSEQADAVQHLADIANPTAFAPTLALTKRDLFAKRLDYLSSILSYPDYLKMLRSFDDELRVWLVHNGLASKSEAATDTCTCSSSGGCASGYACENVTCVHEGGTTHDGRCGAVLEQ